MTPRRVRIASRVIAAADAAILAWGVLALFSPGQLVPGYEQYTGQSWPALMHTSPATGGFILLLFRLVGALNIAVALPLSVLALTAFRAQQRWAWWTLLAANTIAFLAPITYDITTGPSALRDARMGPPRVGVAGPDHDLAFLRPGAT